MDSTASVNLEEGKVLANRYKVEKVLGQGGMGAVYLARDGSLGDKAVAIKEMRVTAADDKGQQAALKQFRQEAQFLANLEHPNLVQVSDFFSDEGRHYLVMAFVKGQNLGEMLLARKGAFPVAKVLEWGRQLAGVLHYLHTQDPPILFRDLKPSNIMLDSAGNVRLIDFGIARSFNPEGVTATFLQGMGSAGYSPLEQYQGAGGTDPRSDIYALGATLFHLVTNRVPPSPVELVSENKPMPSPKRWNPTLPNNIDQILLKMLAVRKDDRYQTMEQVRALLDQAAKHLEQADDDGATESLGSAPSLPPPSSTPLAQVPTMQVRSAVPTTPMESDPNSGILYMTIGMLTMAAIGLFGFLAYQATHQQASPTPSPVVAVSTPRPKPSQAPPAKHVPVKPTTRPEQQVRPETLATRPPAPQPRPTQAPRVNPPPRPQVERPSLPSQPSVPVAAHRPKLPAEPPPVPVQLPAPLPQETAPAPAPAPAQDPFAFAPPTKTEKSGGKRFSMAPGWVWYGKTRGGWAWEWPGHSPPNAPPPPEPDANGNLGFPGGPPPGGGPPGW